MKNTKQTYVPYHASCPDGFGAAWAFHHHLGCQECGEPVSYIPQAYGNNVPNMEPGSQLFILDFSYPRETILELQGVHERVVLLDHHKTAAEKLQGVPNCHIDQRHSGAFLAWQYFNPAEKPPSLILYVQDRDLWQWALPNSREVSEAIASYPNTFAAWDSFDVTELAGEGADILRYMHVQVDKLVGMATRMTVANWPNIPTVNTPLMVSETCEALLEKYPDAPFSATYSESNTRRRWSLRARGTEDTDVSEIAKQMGGGGHKNAAGFVQNKNSNPNPDQDSNPDSNPNSNRAGAQEERKMTHSKNNVLTWLPEDAQVQMNFYHRPPCNNFRLEGIYPNGEHNGDVRHFDSNFSKLARAACPALSGE